MGLKLAWSVGGGRFVRPVSTATKFRLMGLCGPAAVQRPVTSNVRRERSGIVRSREDEDERGTMHEKIRPLHVQQLPPHVRALHVRWMDSWETTVAREVSAKDGHIQNG